MGDLREIDDVTRMNQCVHHHRVGLGIEGDIDVVDDPSERDVRIDPAGLEYFRTRLVKAPRDAEYALELVVDRCRTRDQQDAAVAALKFKTEVLWAQLDAIERGDTHDTVSPNPEAL